jgi:hypothetical protein
MGSRQKHPLFASVWVLNFINIGTLADLGLINAQAKKQCILKSFSLIRILTRVFESFEVPNQCV